jgi:hypothetical protein
MAGDAARIARETEGRKGKKHPERKESTREEKADNRRRSPRRHATYRAAV